MFVLENGNASKIPHRAKNLLLEDSGLKMAYKLQVPHAVDVAQVTCSLIVLKWVEDLKFHCLAEVVKLKKSPLERADHTSPAKRDEQLFDGIEINYAIRKA